MVYEVDHEEGAITVITVGKREGSNVYTKAKKRNE